MVMRVTGLASGMNIDEIVENMMKAQSIPLNKIKQQKTLLEWQRDSYREMNTLLLDFRSQLTNMKLSSFYRTRSVASTNEDIVSATVASGAGQASYTISKIKSLAVAESRMTNSGISSDKSKVDTTKSLFSIQDAFAKEITWKQGSVESKSIVTKEGEPITLGLADGVKITDVKNMTVEVNGKKYTVIDSGTPESGEVKPNSGEVIVDKDTGELTFGDTIAANSTVKVNYVTDKKVENKTITKDTTQIQLKGALVAGQIKLSFKDGTDTTIELSDKPIVDNSKIGQIIDKDGNKFGEINYETGVITFNSEFSNYFPAETENSEEKPKLELTITSQQNYFSFGLTTHTSKGQIDEKFLIQGSESLNSVMSKVNNSKLGVTMFYDSYSDKVTMTRKETGVYNENGQEIEFTEGDFLTQVLGFQNITPDTPGNYVKAENATFTVNGLETSRQSNTFSMNGVTFTLKKTTDTPVTININNDNDALYENIKNFVDKYNELVEKIEKKLSEPKYKDYLPLTDDEKEELSETQQEKWENMAKSGILRNDSILSGLVTQMRTAIYSGVNQDDLDSAMKSLSAIGITTTADFTTAKLEINESKLKAAIEKDPNSIELLFNGTGATDGQKGVIQRLYDKVNATMDQLKERAGNSYSVNNQFTIGRQLDDLDDRIERFEDRLADLETRYYSQFTAMEQAIQKANSQAAYLAQFFQ
ncbi:flagellar filament capping protein FliD [Caldibacillus thermoamylovorans]|uniref:flagellar filament capping protein FliD n=1 Tax=Caldibacillus thermoamylovorans TaxID=35841 RepID=UPI002041A039|nr:flagellar filament capping protein FliD [Caldibacillus thermoamylovorans]MCM3799488.1 flagellar filament capping protein FliD [Caldibacillus thermoamylovorans]